MPITYHQAMAYIEAFGDPYLQAMTSNAEPSWGLETTRDILHALGDPHLTYPVIHIAGTKGKGSTSALITQGLIEAGLKTGLYISPHLEDFRERMQINRVMIPEDRLAALVERSAPYADQVQGLNKFEFITALAMQYFAEEQVDVAVIETGLGGRLDATNLVQPLLSVITNISMDHVQLLGHSLAEIAREKAGIIKPGVPCVSAPQRPEALAVLKQVAEAQASPFYVVGRDWQVEPMETRLTGSSFLWGSNGDMRAYEVGLAGAFQIENASVALGALELARKLGLPVSSTAAAEGVRRAVWAGRMEVVQERPLCIIDSAHNDYSIAHLTRALRELVLYPAVERPELSIVFGCMADKDIPGMLRYLVPIADHLFLTSIEHPRAASVDLLVHLANKAASQSGNGHRDHIIEIVAAPNLAAALEDARAISRPGDVICVTGSLALAGAARTLLRGHPSSDGYQDEAAPMRRAIGEQAR